MHNNKTPLSLKKIREFYTKESLVIKTRLSPPKTLTDNIAYCPTININVDALTIYSITHYFGFVKNFFDFFKKELYPNFLTLSSILSKTS